MLLGGSHGSGESSSKEQADFGANDIDWRALGLAIAFTLLATTIVSARWFARHRLAQCVGLDDYVILLSLTLSWAMTALIGAEVNGGMGVFAGPVDTTTVAQLVVASNVLWILIVNITKASIVLQYLRIFSSRTIRTICYVFLLLLFPAASWAAFAGIFLCSPTEKLWHPQLPGHCMSGKTYWLSVAGIDIGLDFLILLLPLPAITNLRLPRKQKIGLILVFTLGFLVCLVSVARLSTVLILANARHYVDSALWAIIWSAVEANVGIICASLLSLKPLVMRLFPRCMDEELPPRHSMQVRMIESGDGDVWRDETVKVFPRSTLSSFGKPSTATSGSRESLGMKNASAVPRDSGTPGLSQVEDVNVIEPERPPACRKQGMSLFDMLHEDEREARAMMTSPPRKNSSFIEHC